MINPRRETPIYVNYIGTVDGKVAERIAKLVSNIIDNGIINYNHKPMDLSNIRIVYRLMLSNVFSKIIYYKTFSLARKAIKINNHVQSRYPLIMAQRRRRI